MQETKVTSMETTSKIPAKTEELSGVPQHQVTMYMSDLTEKVVKQYFAPPDATKEDIVAFLGLCKAQNLNPWVSDAYMIPFFGKAGRKYAAVTAYQVLLDRADPYLDGMEIECVPDDAKPERCTVTIWRKSWSRPFKRTTLMEQVMRFKRDGNPMALWETNPRAMLEKCAVTGALRMGVPACRKYFVKEEFYAGNQEAMQSQVEPLPVLSEATVVGAEAVVDDVAYLRGQYFKLANQFFSDEDARHEWQKKMNKDGVLSSDSAATMNEHDFKEAYSWIEAYMQDGSTGEYAPETPSDDTDDPGDPEVPMESADAIQGVLDAVLVTKRERVVQLIAETPIKSIDTPGFTTWWHQLLPEEEGKHFDELSVLDLDILIAAIEARIEKYVDTAASENLF